MTISAAMACEARAALLAERLAVTSDLVDRIRAVVDAVPGRIVFSTSLGREDQAILHAVAASGAAVDLFTLDTGRLFPETLETLVASERRYRLRINVLAPASADVEPVLARDGVLGFRTSIRARRDCCHVRKVLPLKRGLAGASGWITGLRREQATGRAEVPFAAWDVEHALFKTNPLADWSHDRLEAFIAANDIPVNPLHAQGFPSIGCQPCTRAITPGEDIRAGRWWWENEDGKECGLHARPKAKDTAS